MRVVILAAGLGSRLGLTDGLPKCLVDVHGAPYLSRQLSALAKHADGGIIVGGYGIEALREFLGTRAGGWCLIENPDYRWGNLYSLKTARPYLDGDFILFNADHYYAPEIYRAFFSATAEGVTAFCDRDRKLTDDDMKVASVTDAHGVRKVDRIAKTLTTYDYGYVGVTRVSAGVKENYWRALAHVERAIGATASVEQVLAELSHRGKNAVIADVSGAWWTEIDTPEDLRSALRVIAEKTGA